MVLSIGSGYSPEYLLKEVATGRENYYTGAVSQGEPPGRWFGAGAERLGLSGLVDAQDMRALYEGFLDPRDPGFKDPQRWDEVSTLGHTGRKYLSEEALYAQAIEREPGASAERRAELRTEAGKAARHNVAFYDVTFNVQKSVTLVHTAFEAKEVEARRAGDEEAAQAWAQCRKAVEDAIWAGNNAGLAYLAEHAGYTRIGRHGGAAGRWADAHDWTIASFFQHDSREHDPHLHIHNAVLNRVQGPDGKWRTIDSRALYKFQRAAAAVAERTTEERITHAIGVWFATRPDGKAREIVGVSQEAMDLISTRRRKLTAKADELIEAFEARYGRAPNGLERDRIAQQATLLTRQSKSHTGETREELLDRIDARVRADIHGGLTGVADMVLAARENAPDPMAWSPQAVIETALADIQSRKAGWHRGDVTGPINAALPDHLGLPDGIDVGRLLDTLTDTAVGAATVLDGARPGDEHLPAELRLEDGSSAYQAPGSMLYATPDQVRTERALVAASTAGGATALPYDRAQRFLSGMSESGIELGVDQAAAVRGVLTSGARIETLVGPAGTGKSFVVGAIARGWTSAEHADEVDRRVFGLATSQIATEVLKAEGLTASNVAAWLGAQRRLTAAAGSGEHRPADSDHAWRLHTGDLVVVDESAMTDTAALAAIHRHVDAAGAKLLLVGDHRQLAAVGAGGGMDLLAQSGARYELAEARRFTHGWERDASLRLRAGDESVLSTYHQQGRLIDAGTTDAAENSAARAWLGDTLAGQQSLLLVDTNEQAARLCAAMRAELVRLGHVQEHGVALGLQGTVAGVGDVVEARAIAWDLAGYEGNPRGVINRERFRVIGARADGGLDVAPIDGHGPGGEHLGPSLVLPARYVAEHLALGYASTVHATQGSTVDTTHTVVTSRTGPAALYVGMSRGKEANTAHVATLTGVDDPARGSEHAHALHRDPIAMLSRVLETTRQADAANRSALATAIEAAAEAGSARTATDLLSDAAQLAATERTATWLDQLAQDGVLDPAQRSRIAAEDGAATLTRILRRAELAGLDPRQVLHDAIAERPFDGVRNASNAIYSRIRTEHDDQLDPVGDSFTGWIPRVDNPEWSRYLGVLADVADQRADQLGAELADDAPQWLTSAIGEPPVDSDARAEWQRRAGVVAVYREMRGHDDPADALGPTPKAGQVEQYAAYRAAWRTLGRPEIEREELEMTDGQLRMWIRAAQREEAWAPRYVANELAGTRQAAATHRRTAEVREAEAAADPAERERLQTEAAQARALAETLDEQAERLQVIDDARSRFLADNARTLGYGRRCDAELTRRHIDDPEPEQLVTADEWLAAEGDARLDDDRHREVTENDIAEHTDANLATDTAVDAAEMPDRDIREIAAAEPEPVHEDAVRVPSADETADDYAKATRALAEIDARRAMDMQEENEHRAEQLNRWHADDQAAEVVDVDEQSDSYDDAIPDPAR